MTLHRRCYPDIRRRLAARFDRDIGEGRRLDTAIFPAAAALLTFLGVLVAVVLASPVDAADQRALHFFATLRTPELDRVMYFLTYIGSGRVVTVIAGTSALVALLFRRRRDAALLVLSPAAAAGLFEAVKLLVRRPRPPLSEARILAQGFSFPSGHTLMSTALWGTVALLAALALRRSRLSRLVCIGAAALVFLIGISRVYLGVHYATDVLAGWAGGAFWVALAFALTRIFPTKGGIASARPMHSMRYAAAALSALGAAAYIALTRPSIPPPPQVLGVTRYEGLVTASESLLRPAHEAQQIQHCESQGREAEQNEPASFAMNSLVEAPEKIAGDHECGRLRQRPEQVVEDEFA
jgi:undecaprenyl-diphosphatase